VIEPTFRTVARDFRQDSSGSPWQTMLLSQGISLLTLMRWNREPLRTAS
jgi:hypothetical protein